MMAAELATSWIGRSENIEKPMVFKRFSYQNTLLYKAILTRRDNVKTIEKPMVFERFSYQNTLLYKTILNRKWKTGGKRGQGGRLGLPGIEINEIVADCL